MEIVGLDLNASRARAVRGEADAFPLPLLLDPPEAELPLCLYYDGRNWRAGREGWRQRRQQPHRVWHPFLPQLGRSCEEALRWRLLAPRLAPAQALAQVLAQVRSRSPAPACWTVALPDYLLPEQVACYAERSREQGLAPHGLLPTSLALALAGFAEQAWFRQVLVLEVDDYALSLAALGESDGQAQRLGQWLWPGWNRSTWLARLSKGLAERCIRMCRRDPRVQPATEQALWDQVEHLLLQTRQGQVATLMLQAAHWSCRLAVSAEELAELCQPLVSDLLAAFDRLCQIGWPGEVPPPLLLTWSAALLPGLVAAFQRYYEARQASVEAAAGEEDLGLGLAPGGAAGQPEPVVVLPADAAARGAHGLVASAPAGGLYRDKAPLPLPRLPEVGPARLIFQGEEYFLAGQTLRIGCRSDCDLVLGQERYPEVAPCHCEIVYTPRAYQLRDLSREGTWINDQPVTAPVFLQPGDWIRLGPHGPLLRFLGQDHPLTPATQPERISHGKTRREISFLP
jgi:hypothetical protein